MLGFSKAFFLLCFAYSLFAQNVIQLSLEEAEKIALKNNKPFMISKEHRKAEKESYLQSASDLFPRISYSGSFTRTFDPSLVENVTNAALTFEKNLLIQKFQLIQPLLVTDLIFDFKEKKLSFKRAEEREESVKNDLLFQVRDAYFYLLLQQIALLIQKENVEYLQAALEVEEGRYRFGNGTILEVNQSKVATTNAISEYYETVKLYKDARNRLIHILGIDPGLENQLSISLCEFPLYGYDLLKEKLLYMEKTFSYDPNTFPKEHQLILQEEVLTSNQTLSFFSREELDRYVYVALSLRPDLEMRRLSVDIANEEVKKNRGHYFPVVTGFLDYTRNGGEPDARFFSIDPFSWAVGVKFSWNIFDSLSRERKIRKSVYEKKSASVEYTYAIQTIETNIRNLLYQMEDSIYAYLTASSGVLVAEQAMVQAREKLQYGKIPPLDYRDAANQLAKAKNLRNRASYSLLLSYFLFRRTLGLDVVK